MMSIEVQIPSTSKKTPAEIDVDPDRVGIFIYSGPRAKSGEKKPYFHKSVTVHVQHTRLVFPIFPQDVKRKMWGRLWAPRKSQLPHAMCSGSLD